MFTNGRGTVGALDFAGLSTEGVGLPVSHARFDLTVGISERDDTLEFELSYSSDLFDHATVERMGRHLVELLSRVARAPHKRLSRTTFLTAGESRRLLAEWNDTAVPEPDR